MALVPPLTLTRMRESPSSKPLLLRQNVRSTTPTGPVDEPQGPVDIRPHRERLVYPGNSRRAMGRRPDNILVAPPLPGRGLNHEYMAQPGAWQGP